MISLAESTWAQYITLTLKKDKSLLSPETKTFKESTTHELTHGIHFQNNEKLSFYHKSLNSTYNNSNNDEAQSDIRKAFSEGFANHITGDDSYINHKGFLDLIKRLDNLNPSDNNYYKRLNNLSKYLDNPYTFGSLIFNEIKRLKGEKFVIDYAFKKSGFTPEDMQEDYNTICREQNKKPIPYLDKLTQIQKALSTHSAKHQLAWCLVSWKYANY